MWVPWVTNLDRAKNTIDGLYGEINRLKIGIRKAVEICPDAKCKRDLNDLLNKQGD